MIVTPTPHLNNFKHSLNKRKHNQPYISTPDFDSELNQIQERVNRVRSGSERSPLQTQRLSWEDEKVLHQFDDEPHMTESEGGDIQKEYQRPFERDRKLVPHVGQNDHVDEKY